MCLLFLKAELCSVFSFYQIIHFYREFKIIGGISYGKNKDKKREMQIFLSIN